MSTYNTGVFRGNGGASPDALVPQPFVAEVIKELPKKSTVLNQARMIPMSAGTSRMPVLSVLPTAYWVNGDNGLKQTATEQWKNVNLVAEELAALVPVPNAYLDDSGIPIWDEIKPSLAEAIGNAFDAAALFAVNKPASWTSASMYDSAVAAGNTYTQANVSAVQTVTITGGPTGGTFTISYNGQTTAGIAYNATAATVQTAFTGLSTVGSGNATVAGSAGGPYTITFSGSLANTSVGTVTASGASLTGGTSPAATAAVVTTGSSAGDPGSGVAQLGTILAKDGYAANGFSAAPGFSWNLVGYRSAQGVPVYQPNPADSPGGKLYGYNLDEVLNGSWDSTKASLIAADWTKVICGIRQDITFTMHEDGIISDDSGVVIYNAMQQDSTIMRVVFRGAYATANPVTRLNPTSGTRSPFAVLGPIGALN